MSYAKVVDVPAAKYVVIVLHSEYELSVRFFVSKEKAYEAYELELGRSNEAYIAELLA